jgi:hypothetical protein
MAGLCGHNLECRAAVVAFDTIRHTLPLTQCRHDCRSVTPQRMYGVNQRDNVVTSGGVGDLALAAANPLYIVLMPRQTPKPQHWRPK